MSRRTLFAIASVLLALVLVGGSSTPSTAKPTAKPRTPYKITIEASATTVAVGQTIVYTGKVRPASKAVTKQKVKLQIAYGTYDFETYGYGEPNRKGKYEVSDVFSTPGTYVVRARIAAGKGHTEGISEELTITVTP